MSSREESGSLLLQDPTGCQDWDEAISKLPAATVFFSSGWARVLQNSYGYRPFYLTTRRGNAWTGCLPVMEIENWLSGRRGVSLPFTDECAPLAADPAAARALLEQAIELGRERGWRRLELHGGGEAIPGGGDRSISFFGHQVDLRRTPEALFESFEGSIRRGIRKAERAGLEVELTRTGAGLRTYYGLHCHTRKRHGLPPQPWSFFEQIQEQMLSKEAGFVVLVRYHGRAIAGAVFLQFARHAIYKYGASKLAFQELRPNNLAIWEGIRHLARQGTDQLSLGRTSVENEGLRRFKRGWGAVEYPIWYSRFDYRRGEFVTVPDDAKGWHTGILRLAPECCLRMLGRVLYRYCG